jgi:hypothetical protein
MRPINPPLPLFTACCVRCGERGHSLSMATCDAPFTFACWRCQDDATRHAVWLANNKFIETRARSHPHEVADARRGLGFRRPRHVNADDPSWAGCPRED